MESGQNTVGEQCLKQYLKHYLKQCLRYPVGKTMFTEDNVSRDRMCQLKPLFETMFKSIV